MPLNNSITSIKNYFDIGQGLQRTNRFSVSFLNTPVQIPYSDILVDQFTLNLRVLDQIADNLAGYGIGRLIPRRQSFQKGFVLVFPVLGDNKIISFFDSWLNRLYGKPSLDSPGNFNLDYYDNTVKNCKCFVNLLDLNGNKASTFTFYEIFPTEVLPITLLNNSKDEYLKLTVTFNFRNYKYER